MLLLGWFGAVLLGLAAVPQAWKVLVRDGHADGMAWPYVVMLWLGFSFMGVFSYLNQSGAPLVASYCLQVVLFTAIMFRKARPRRVSLKDSPL